MSKWATISVELHSYYYMQVPHAFQQHLSYEKTPTPCNEIPSFEALRSKWEEHKTQHPKTAHLIQPGINKLADYQGRTRLVPAYMLAMGMSSITIYTA